ncbi:hypothetical protein JCM10908_001935 [Rhodotorula pacifica]|uniref:pyridoxal phosphate-dependent aminotransferase n=1 Tax=Rhodotorula pacifica TaxID=1495444 RepID=UPI0031746E51
MSLHPLTLSQRANDQLDAAANSPPLYPAFAGASWSEETPEGFVNAGLAENSLMHDWLREFWQREGSLQIDHTDLTYSTSVLGSDRLFESLSRYFNAYFKPFYPILPKHIATSNGLGPMIEKIAAVISDPEDAWLVPAPYYNAFKADLGASQVRIASVQIPLEQYGTLAEVELVDAELERRRREGVEQKIKAILVTNPHNPLGFCYSREVLLAYCRLAERWNLFLVSDEIYANSVYDSADLPNAPTFTSVLSLDVHNDAGCDPARVIVLYGMSKDFGANGFRAGAMVCQHNLRFMQALATNARGMRMGSPSQILWSALMDSDDLPLYLSQNRLALSRAYAYLTAWLKAHNLPYVPANAGHFVVVDLRKYVAAVERGDEGRQGTGENLRFEDEIAFLNRLVDNGVFLGPGTSYACPSPGYFRLTFSIRRKELEVALERIETVCGLPPRAIEISGNCPE